MSCMTCACGLAAGDVSDYLCNCCLSQYLRDCATGREVWLPHPSYPYEVSNLGRVRGLKRGTVLTPEVTEGGYLRVRMPDCWKKVHALVLETFISPRPDGCECLHEDNDPTNNRLRNLAWNTPEANRDDARRHRLAAAARERAVAAEHRRVERLRQRLASR